MAEREVAALHLAFYLASWGMYRGSGFLLQHDYTIHLNVIDCLAAPAFAPLWENEFGANDDNSILIPIILKAAWAIEGAYKPCGIPSEILITKILLGTLGCLPAVDKYFKAGFKQCGLPYSGLGEKFVDRVFRFCRENVSDLRREQNQISRNGGVHYPLMKLVDMHFHQIGLGI